MEKISFEIGDKVVAIEQSRLKRGVIKDIYHLCTPILIVKFENGNVEKCVISEVAPAPDEKNGITITQDEFRDISINMVTDLTVDKTITVADGTIFTIILSLIAKKLFGDEVKENA